MTQQTPTLYMVLLGCKPKGRLTEQHDIFFGTGTSIIDLKSKMYDFWPDGGRLHVDAWRAVTALQDHTISVVPKGSTASNEKKLFFINLGGYRPGEFEEYHHKMLIIADSISEAIKLAKQTGFYKNYGFEGAVSHIDDKYALDVDDAYDVEDILPAGIKERYSLHITESKDVAEDMLHIGYLKLGNL